MSEWELLLQNLRQAEQNFDRAEPQYINTAIRDVMEAEVKINQYLEERRKKNGQKL